MAVTVNEVVDAFGLLFDALLNRDFSKTLRLHECCEKELLPLVRTFLLGYSGESIVLEAQAVLPGSLSGYGRLDFLVGNVAVELAVRRRGARAASLSAYVNSGEVKKLMKHNGLAVLVLFDFSGSPCQDEDIESFREWPSLGKGNHTKGPFNAAYFYISSRHPYRTDVIRKNIRVF
jgi:hypothetical protein